MGCRKVTDPFDHTKYKIIDRRTGKRASLGTYGPLWYAHDTIVGWRKRARQRGGDDRHGILPFLAIAIEDN